MQPNPDTNPIRFHSPLLRLGSFLTLLSLLTLASNPALSAPATDSISAATVEAWLASMDKGEFAKSWEAAADGFRQAVTKEKWVEMSKQIRAPLGAMISRKVRSTEKTNALPD